MSESSTTNLSTTVDSKSDIEETRRMNRKRYKSEAKVKIDDENKIDMEKSAEVGKLSLTYDATEARELSEEIMKAFRPFEFIMKFFLRFPLVHERLVDGTYNFKFIPNTFQTIGFLVTGFFLIAILILALINLMGTLLDYPSQTIHKGKNGTITNEKNVRAEELFLFQRNIGPVLMIMTGLAHSTVGIIHFYLKRHFAASCLTFWTQAAGLLKINLAKGVKKYFTWVLSSYGIVIFLLIILNITQYIPVATGAPGILGMLLGRVFNPYLYALNNFFIFRSFCSFIFFYILICSKIYILLFLFQCKLLKNAFSVWNERLERALHGDESETTTTGTNPSDKSSTIRTGFVHLFKDHICLLDMIDGTDRLFANIIETYFGTQLVSICFEIYYFYRSQAAKDEFHEARRLDGVYVLVYLIQTVLILFVVSKSAADVGSTTMNGLEIIRRKGMMGKKTDEEIYFILSMYISFNGHFDTVLGGGKYFVMDNSFLVGITGTIFSYFIILIQFTPRLSYAGPKAQVAYLNTVLGGILANFEGTRNLIPHFSAETYLKVD